MFDGIIKGKKGKDRGVSFPGGPLTELVTGNYYVVAVLEPVFQVAIMRLSGRYRSDRVTEWECYLPPTLSVGPAKIIPLVELGDEAI